MTAIKAFITDIDGTIVPHGGQFTPAIASALTSLKSNNIAVIINTARAFHRVSEDLPLHHFSNHTVTNIGSEIRDKEGRILHIEFIGEGAIASLRDIAREVRPQSLIAYIDGTLTPLIYSSSDAALTAYSRRYGRLGFRKFSEVDDFFQAVDKAKLSAVIFRDSMENPLKHKLTAAFTDIFEISEIDKTTHVVTKKGINKQSSILRIAEMLGITAFGDEILSAGDSLVDDKMFEITTGIAVGMIDLPHAAYRVADPEALGRFLLERYV